MDDPRLIVRRVRNQAKLEELLPVWRYHPFFTNSDEPTVEADLTHQRHAAIETVFADLIDGPPAHLPLGPVLREQRLVGLRDDHLQPLRAADAPRRKAGQPLLRGATLRRQIIHLPAEAADPNHGRCCTCPSTGPGPTGGWRSGPENQTSKGWADQRSSPTQVTPEDTDAHNEPHQGRPGRPLHGSRLSLAGTFAPMTI